MLDFIGREPWAHQRQAVERAQALKEFALFFEPGTGKSRTSIDIFRHWCNGEKRYLRTLILAPLIVCENWKREFEMYSKLPQDRVITLTGPGPRRLKTFQLYSQEQGFPRGCVFVTNYEALVAMPELFKAIKAWGPEVLICDESHRCKDMKSKRTKAVIALADQAERKLILSGTPILNSPMDIFAQYRILDGGRTFGSNFFAFRARFFYDKNAGMPRDRHFPTWQILPGALEAMNGLIYSKAMRVTKAECLDLPPLVRKSIYVDLSPEQRRLYDEMKKDFVTYIKDKAVVATLAITKALRLMQIVSGYTKTFDGEEVALEKTPKMAALEEILADTAPTSKCIIWSVFKENYAQIRRVCENLGLEYVEVHGEISDTKKFEAVERFQKDPNVRVFIGHPGSGGIGINLVEAPVAIFYSRNFSLDQDLQAEARNHRGGSQIHEKVTRIDLIAKGTIDEAVVQRLANKLSVSDTVLKQIAEEI